MAAGSTMSRQRTVTTGEDVDPYFDNVVLLMSMEGTDDGTTFTDTSNNGEFLVEAGSVTSTDEVKFGTAALFNAALGDGVDVAGVDVITDNQASFTMEAWIYLLGSAYVGASIAPGGGQHCIIGQPKNVGSGECWFAVSSTGRLRWSRTASAFGGDLVDVIGTSTLAENQWIHVALSYDASTTTARIFVDGDLETTDSSVPDGGWPTTADDGMEGFRIGNMVVPNFIGFQQTLNGYIDELRVTQGVARYTASFARPTEPFPAPTVTIPGIVESGLLLHLDAADATCFGAAETSATNLISSETVTGANGEPGTGAHTPNTANFPEWNSINGGIFDFAGGRGINVDEDLGTHTEFTIDIWYYKAGNGGTVYLTDGRNDSGSWFLTNYTSNHNLTYTGLATYNFDVAYDAGNTDFIDRWQHLTFTSDGTGSKMYIDGTERTLLSSSSVDEDLGVNFRIGTRYTTSGEWTGYMGPIKIYDRALTASEALQNFNANKSRFDGTDWDT